MQSTAVDQHFLYSLSPEAFSAILNELPIDSWITLWKTFCRPIQQLLSRPHMIGVVDLDETSLPSTVVLRFLTILGPFTELRLPTSWNIKLQHLPLLADLQPRDVIISCNTLDSTDPFLWNYLSYGGKVGRPTSESAKERERALSLVQWPSKCDFGALMLKDSRSTSTAASLDAKYSTTLSLCHALPRWSAIFPNVERLWISDLQHVMFGVPTMQMERKLELPTCDWLMSALFPSSLPFGRLTHLMLRVTLNNKGYFEHYHSRVGCGQEEPLQLLETLAHLPPTLTLLKLYFSHDSSYLYMDGHNEEHWRLLYDHGLRMVLKACPSLETLHTNLPLPSHPTQPMYEQRSAINPILCSDGSYLKSAVRVENQNWLEFDCWPASLVQLRIEGLPYGAVPLLKKSKLESVAFDAPMRESRHLDETTRFMFWSPTLDNMKENRQAAFDSLVTNPIDLNTRYPSTLAHMEVFVEDLHSSGQLLVSSLPNSLQSLDIQFQLIDDKDVSTRPYGHRRPRSPLEMSQDEEGEPEEMSREEEEEEMEEEEMEEEEEEEMPCVEPEQDKVVLSALANLAPLIHSLPKLQNLTLCQYISDPTHGLLNDPRSRRFPTWIRHFDRYWPPTLTSLALHTFLTWDEDTLRIENLPSTLTTLKVGTILSLAIVESLSLAAAVHLPKLERLTILPLLEGTRPRPRRVQGTHEVSMVLFSPENVEWLKSKPAFMNHMTRYSMESLLEVIASQIGPKCEMSLFIEPTLPSELWPLESVTHFDFLEGQYVSRNGLVTGYASKSATWDDWRAEMFPGLVHVSGSTYEPLKPSHHLDGNQLRLCSPTIASMSLFVDDNSVEADSLLDYLSSSLATNIALKELHIGELPGAHRRYTGFSSPIEAPPTAFASLPFTRLTTLRMPNVPVCIEVLQVLLKPSLEYMELCLVGSDEDLWNGLDFNLPFLRRVTVDLYMRLTGSLPPLQGTECMVELDVNRLWERTIEEMKIRASHFGIDIGAINAAASTLECAIDTRKIIYNDLNGESRVAKSCTGIKPHKAPTLSGRAQARVGGKSPALEAVEIVKHAPSSQNYENCDEEEDDVEAYLDRLEKMRAMDLFVHPTFVLGHTPLLFATPDDSFRLRDKRQISAMSAFDWPGCHYPLASLKHLKLHNFLPTYSSNLKKLIASHFTLAQEEWKYPLLETIDLKGVRDEHIPYWLGLAPNASITVDEVIFTCTVAFGRRSFEPQPSNIKKKRGRPPKASKAPATQVEPTASPSVISWKWMFEETIKNLMEWSNGRLNDVGACKWTMDTDTSEVDTEPSRRSHTLIPIELIPSQSEQLIINLDYATSTLKFHPEVYNRMAWATFFFWNNKYRSLLRPGLKRFEWSFDAHGQDFTKAQNVTGNKGGMNDAQLKAFDFDLLPVLLWRAHEPNPRRTDYPDFAPQYPIAQSEFSNLSILHWEDLTSPGYLFRNMPICSFEAVMKVLRKSSPHLKHVVLNAPLMHQIVAHTPKSKPFSLDMLPYLEYFEGQNLIVTRVMSDKVTSSSKPNRRSPPSAVAGNFPPLLTTLLVPQLRLSAGPLPAHITKFVTHPTSKIKPTKK